MSSANPSRPDPSGSTPPGNGPSDRRSESSLPSGSMGNPATRRRGRFIVPGLILLIIVVVFLIITLVGNFA